MKHFFISLLLCISCICSAQTSHMKFKGIPMEGTLNSFVQKLQKQGYTYIGTKEGTAILKGEFATTKGCTIAVARFAHKDEVNVVAVMFPEMKSWSTVYNSYSTYKEMLTEKYGQPECVEEFSEGTTVYDDYTKFRALTHDECNFVTEFTTDNGRIQLTMSKMDYNSASVVIKYIDDENAAETRKKVMEDL